MLTRTEMITEMDSGEIARPDLVFLPPGTYPKAWKKALNEKKNRIMPVRIPQKSSFRLQSNLQFRHVLHHPFHPPIGAPIIAGTFLDETTPYNHSGDFRIISPWTLLHD